jgi:hypothetical protein
MCEDCNARARNHLRSMLANVANDLIQNHDAIYAEPTVLFGAIADLIHETLDVSALDPADRMKIESDICKILFDRDGGSQH